MKIKDARQERKEIVDSLEIVQEALNDYEEKGGDVLQADKALDILRKYLISIIIADGSEQQEYEAEMNE